LTEISDSGLQISIKSGKLQQNRPKPAFDEKFKKKKANFVL